LLFLADFGRLWLMLAAIAIATKNQPKAAKISRKHPKSAEISQNQTKSAKNS
jgi:hypothetical protein